MGQKTLNVRTSKMTLMYNFSNMFLHMCNLLCDFFVIFIALVFLLWLLAQWVVPMGTPVNFDNPLLDWNFTQKLHNNFYNVYNNTKNVLKLTQNIYQLSTRHTAQLVAGGPVTGELLYILTNFNDRWHKSVIGSSLSLSFFLPTQPLKIFTFVNSILNV